MRPSTRLHLMLFAICLLGTQVTPEAKAGQIPGPDNCAADTEAYGIAGHIQSIADRLPERQSSRPDAVYFTQADPELIDEISPYFPCIAAKLGIRISLSQDGKRANAFLKLERYHPTMLNMSPSVDLGSVEPMEDIIGTRDHYWSVKFRSQELAIVSYGESDQLSGRGRCSYSLYEGPDGISYLKSKFQSPTKSKDTTFLAMDVLNCLIFSSLREDFPDALSVGGYLTYKSYSNTFP